MREMTKEDVRPELDEAVFALVRKVEVISGVPRKDALQIVAAALRSSAEDLEAQANGTKLDEE